MKNIIAIALFVIVFLVSCTPKTIPVKETSSTISQTSTVATAPSLDKLEQGKTIYDNSCGTCHDLPNPTDFTSVEWIGIMNSMAPKAKLTDEQHQLVYDYVVSVKK